MGILNDIGTFVKGTAQAMLGDGWKGVKTGLWAALGVGVVAGLVVAATPLAAGWGIVAGIVAGGASLVPAASWGAGIGGGWGILTGGFREMKKSSISKEQSMEATRANAEYRLATAQQQNANIKTAIGHHVSDKGHATHQSRATSYQMHNHLADGNAADKFQSQFAAEKAAKGQQVTSGGVGK